MSETIGTAQIEVTGNASGFDSTVKQAKKSLADLGAAASKTGKDTAQGMGQAGAATDKLDAATKRAAVSIERQALALGKSKSEYYAAKAAIDGNAAALAPYIAKLREAEANVAATANAQKRLAESSTVTARAFGAIAATLSVAKLVQIADAVTTLQNQLKLAAGSTAGAAVAYEALFDIAQRSRVSFTELGGVYASVARAGASLGVSQGRLLKVTESIGNALTISGGSAASMQAALVQLSQGLASGTLRGEELNSVMEQTPRLAKALADGLGVSIGELREMGKAGLLTSEQVIQALESQSAALAREVKNATLSVGQAFTVLQNSATKFVGDADKATGASGALAGALVSVSKGIDSVGKSLSENGTLITTVLGGVAGAGALAGLAAVAGNLGKIRVAVLALSAALAANPVTLALLGIGAAVGGGIAYVSSYKKTADGIKATIDALNQENERAKKALDFSANMGPKYQGGDAETRRQMDARVEQVRKLRAELALLENQQLDTRAEDARFAASTRNVKVNEQLAESMEGIRLRVAGVNKDYTQFYADLDVYQKARASGMITEQEYVSLVSKLSIEYAKGTKATKANKDAEKDRWEDIKKRRQEQVDDTNSYLAGLQITAKEEADAAAAVAKAYAAAMEKQDAYTASLSEQVVRQLEQNAAIGLTAEELVKLEVAKLNDAAASKERLASDLAAAGESDRLVKAYRDQAAELRALAAAKAEGGTKQAGADAAEVAREAAKQATEDWKRAAAEIENDITDALMRGFESGKGFAENLRDVVVNMFKTLVLRPVIQGVVQGGLNAVGLGGSAAGGSNLLGSVSNLSSLYNTGSRVAGWLGLGSAATGTGLAATAGSGLALTSAAGTGLGLTAGAGTGLSLAGTSTGLGLTASAGTGTALTAGAGAGASSALAAIPGWGWALAGLALLAGSGFGKSPGEQAKGGYYSSRGLDATLDNARAITPSDAAARDLINREDAGLKTFTQQTVDGLLAATTSRAKALGLDIALGIDAGVAANLNGKGKDKNAFGYAQIFANGELAGEYSNRALGEDLVAAGQKFAADLADAAAKAVLAGTDFGRTGETASATLVRLGDSLAAVNDIFDTLGTTLFDASLAGGNLASQLADAAGGMDRLTALAGEYYQAFYSDAERAATTTRQVSEALAELGITTMPTTREGFRALVEAQDLTTEAGRKTYAALLGVSGAFASVTAESLDVAAELAGARAEYQRSLDSVAEATRAAAAEAQRAADEFQRAFAAAGQNIKSFAVQLAAEVLSGSADGRRLAAANYATDLALARRGDLKASERITSSASLYVQEQQANANSAFDARRAALIVAGQLNALPAVKTHEQLLLEAVNATTGAVTALGGSLTVELEASARSEILKLIEFVADTDKLPADLKALALGTSSTLRKTVDYVVGSSLPEDLKALALTNVSALAKTVNFIGNSTGLTDEMKALALKSTDTLSKTINFVVGSSLPADLKTLALGATSTLTKTIDFLANSTALPADLKVLALKSTDTLSKTVNFVVGSSLTAEMKTLALATTSDLTKFVKFVADSTALPADLKTLALKASDTVSRVISLSASNLLRPDDQRLALSVSDTITKTINAAAGSMNAQAMLIAIAQSGTIEKMIMASGGQLTADQAKLLDGISSYSKMVTLGIEVDESSLTAAQALLKTVFGTIDLGTITSGGATGTGGVSLADVLGADTVSRLTSIRNYINSLNWAPENKYASAWTTYEAAKTYGVTQAEIATATGYYLSDVQALFDAAGVPRFAMGGVFANSVVTRPTMFNMAEMGEAGPEAIMPLTRTASGNLGVEVKLPDWARYGRGDDAALAEEVRALREENRAQARAMVALQQRMTKLLERWDGQGLPEERSVA